MSLDELSQTLWRAYEKFRVDPLNGRRVLHDAYLARGFHHQQNGSLIFAFWDYARADVVASSTSFDALQSMCQCALEMRWYGETAEIASRAIARVSITADATGEMMDIDDVDKMDRIAEDASLLAATRFFETMREEAVKRAERDCVFLGTRQPLLIPLKVCAKYAGLKQKASRKIVYRGTLLDVRPSRNNPDFVGIHATVRYRVGDRILVEPPMLACHMGEMPVCDHCGNDLSLYANTFTSCLFACGACFCSRPCLKSALETHHPVLCKLKRDTCKNDNEHENSLQLVAMKKLIALSIGTKTSLLIMAAITDPLNRDLTYYPTTSIQIEWPLIVSFFNFLASVEKLHDPDFDLPNLLLAYHVVTTSLIPLHVPYTKADKEKAVVMQPLKMRYIRRAKYGNVRKEGDKLFATKPILPDSELVLPQ